MHFRWVRVGRRLNIPRWAVAVIAAWLTLATAAIVLQKITGKPLLICWFRRLVGIPCPTCGATRAVMALARGQLIESWLYNPLVVTLGLLGGAWLIARCGFGRALSLGLTPRQRRLAWAGFWLLFLANWAYVIAWHVANHS